MNDKKEGFMEGLENRAKDIVDVIPHNQDLSKLNEPLNIKEIDFRVQSVNKGGYATILAYKDARVDMNRLDKVVGSMYWKREMLDDNRRCRVSIYNKDLEQWIQKEDVGTASATEKEKGLASDSFKRACFNWGIGRELYDYPMISIKLTAKEWNAEAVKADKTGHVKPKSTWDFKLKEWIWFSQFTDGELNYLAAKDDKGVVRFTHGVYVKTK